MPIHVASDAHSPRASISRPLSAHPELEIVCTPLGPDGNHIEYRLYNFTSLRSGRVVRGDNWGFIDVLCAGSFVWSAVVHGVLSRLAGSRQLFWGLWSLAVLAWAWSKSRTVIYQSVVPLPGLGLQLTTALGIALPFATSSSPRRTAVMLSRQHRFISLSDISTVIINEGLTRWSVRFYLAIVKRRGDGIIVAFDELSPRHAVLVEVYHGVREILFDEYAEDDTGDDEKNE